MSDNVHMNHRHCFKGISLVVLCCASVSAQTYSISTLAGNGTQGFLDGPLAGSQVFSPSAIAIDSSGNVYIADTGNHRIRKVSGGNISTVAGNGTAGFTGDGGQATSAELNAPGGVAVDSSGNLYIADTQNFVVRKVTTGGVISTFAGSGGISGYQGDGGVATGALFASPNSVAVDSAGNVYVSDGGINNLIRKISGGNITSVVGSGATAQRINNPTGIALDASGALYIADTGNKRIAKFAAGVLTNFAGNESLGFSGDNGLAILAQLGNPTGVAVDSAGNVYIADTNNSRIRKVTNGVITTIAGTGRTAYTGDGGPATSGSLFFPKNAAVDSSGNVYICDSGNNAIRELQPIIPVISANGVGNAASGQAQVSPGALASVYGANFPSTSQGAASIPLPTVLGGASVTVNGRTAPVLFVSAGQINFQVPWETTVGTATVVVNVLGGNSNTMNVPVVSAGPGLFFSPGTGAAIAANSDFTLNSPSNPAAAGSTIIAYVTGSGPLDNAVADGAASPSSPLARVTSTFSATVGSTTAQVPFLGLAPGFVGVLQANVTIPASLTPGNYPLTITINGQTSNSATISVK